MTRALLVRVQDLRAVGTVELVTGIVDDARDLVEAHVEALRADMSARLVVVTATLTSALIAVGVFMVTALLLSLALAASLVELGIAWWLALWIVTLTTGAIGVGFVFRARAKFTQPPTIEKSQ
jgi:putative superfamily III holin-X